MIAIISENSGIGGISTFCVELCKELDIPYILVIPIEQRITDKWLVNQAKKFNLHFIEIECDNSYSFISELFLLIKNHGIKVIHTNGYKFNSIIKIMRIRYFFNRRPSIKHVASVHGVNPYRIMPLRMKIYNQIDYFTAFMLDKVFCVSEFTKKTYKRRAIINKQKLHVIFNGINKKSNLLEDSKNKYDISFVGRFSYEKGIDFLCKIVENYLFKANNKKYKFHFWGSGELVAEIQQLVSRYPKNIEIHGPTLCSEKILQQSKVFISTSIIENMSFSIIEAMKNRTAVVTTDVGGTHEFLKNNINGFLVKYGDVESFVEKIELLQSNSRLYAEMCNNAYNTYSCRLSSKLMADLYKKQYLSLLI